MAIDAQFLLEWLVLETACVVMIAGFLAIIIMLLTQEIGLLKKQIFKSISDSDNIAQVTDYQNKSKYEPL